MLPPSWVVFLTKSYEHSEFCFLNILQYFLALLSIPFRMHIRTIPADGKRFPGNSLGITVVQTMLTSLTSLFSASGCRELSFKIPFKRRKKKSSGNDFISLKYSLSHQTQGTCLFLTRLTKNSSLPNAPMKASLWQLLLQDYCCKKKEQSVLISPR